MFKGQKSKGGQTRVTVHVFCPLSHNALHCFTLCEVLQKNIRYQSYEADMNDGRVDGQMDGQMDTQNFRVYNVIPLPLFVARHKNP